MEDNLKNAMAEAGFSLTDEMPTKESTQDAVEQTVAPTPVEPEQTEEVREPSASETAPPVAEPAQEAVTEQESEPADDFDFDAEVLKFLSEKLGTEVSGFDAISTALSNKPVEIDERVAAINDFVTKTGRSPEDWYKYQQLNPSEMDDVTAVRNQMVIEHDNLSMDEINMLVNNKYKLDADRYDENEVSLAKLQLKMDAQSARKSISELRDGYQLPVSEQGLKQKD